MYVNGGDVRNASSSSTKIYTTYNSTEYWGGQASVDYWIGNTSVRAPKFIDQNDTSYYLDPANTGTSLVVAGQVKAVTGWFTDNVYLSGGQLYIGASGANATTNDSHRLVSGSGEFKIQSRESGTWTDHFTISTSGVISGNGSGLTNVPATFTGGTVANATTFNSDVTISSAGTGDSPCLRINNLNHTSYNHGIEVYNGNLVAGESEIILIGKTGSTKNSGYIGYNWAADASNNNYVTIGQYGANHLFRIYGDQVLSTVTLRSQSDVRGTLFYDMDNTNYYCDPAGQNRLHSLNLGSSRNFF